MSSKRILVLVLLFVVAFLFVGCLPTVTPPTPKGIIGGRIMVPGPEITKDITGWIPLANATVTITDSEGVTHTVTTDENGYYTFTDIAVDANTIITATGTVDGNTVIVKDVIPQAVAADEDYEAGIADAESTALALIVEELLKQGVDPGDIDLEEIQGSANFTEVVEQVNSILEGNGNVTTDPGLTNTVSNVAEDIINPPGPSPEPTPQPTPTPVKLTSIVVDPKTMNLFVGQKETISVTAHYSDESTVSIALGDCTYLSDATAVATVSTTGLVTAITDGTATITVSYEGKTDTIVVTVTYLPMEIIADLPTFTVGISTEFTVEFVANSDVGKERLIYFTLPSLPDATYTFEYLEVNDGDWYEIVDREVEIIFGPPLPLEDITTSFRAKFNTAGTYSTTVEVRTVPEDEVLCTEVITAEVIDLVQNTDTDDYYHTIQDAIYDAGSGHTILVSAGTYDENITIDRSLTIVSVEGALATIIDTQGAIYGVFIIGASTVATFEGFTVRNYEECGILAGAFTPSEEDPLEVHILNNIVEEPGPLDQHNNCIQVGDGTTGTIIGNEVSGALLVSPDWSGSGILVAGSSNVVVSNNHVQDCEGGIQIAGYAEYKGGPAAISNLIENNLVENCDTGISVQGDSIGTIIRYNDVFNNDTGIGSLAYDLGWPEHSTPSDTEIYYNNIVGNVNYGVKSSVWWHDTGTVLAEEVDARANWWGDMSGPKAVTNPNGLGDTVSKNVIFDPWSESSNF